MEHHPSGLSGEGLVGHPRLNAHLLQDGDGLFLPLPDQVGHHIEAVFLPQADQHAHRTPPPRRETGRRVLRDYHARRQVRMHLGGRPEQQTLLRQEPLRLREGLARDVRGERLIASLTDGEANLDVPADTRSAGRALADHRTLLEGPMVLLTGHPRLQPHDPELAGRLLQLQPDHDRDLDPVPLQGEIHGDVAGEDGQHEESDPDSGDPQHGLRPHDGSLDPSVPTEPADKEPVRLMPMRPGGDVPPGHENASCPSEESRQVVPVGEVRMPGQELCHDVRSLLRLMAAHGIHQHAARGDAVRHPVHDRALKLGESGDIRWLPMPPDLRAPPDRAQACAGGIDQDPVCPFPEMPRRLAGVSSHRTHDGRAEAPHPILQASQRAGAQIEGCHLAPVLHQHGGQRRLAPSSRADIEDPLPRLRIQDLHDQRGCLIHHPEQPPFPPPTGEQIPRMPDPIRVRHPGTRLPLRPRPREKVLELRHTSPEGVPPDRDRGSPIVGLHEMPRLLPQLFQPSLHQPGGVGIPDRVCQDRVLGQLFFLERTASRQGPQNGIDKGPRPAPGQPDRLVDRRVARNLGQMKELVCPESQEIPHVEINRLKRPIQDA